MSEQRDQRNLVLYGTLHADNRFTLRTSHLAEDGSVRFDPASPLVAVLLDEKDVVLARHGVPIAHSCQETATSSIIAHGVIPFHPATQTVRLFWNEIQVYELPVSEHGPAVRLTWEPPKLVAGAHEVFWEADHPMGTPLQFFLRYMNSCGTPWRRVGWRTKANRILVDFDQLPGGDWCRIEVLATDGVNTAAAQSSPFVVPIKSCQAMILGPSDSAIVELGSALKLRGQGFYLEENVPETEALYWRSSLDGRLGQGIILEVPALSLGEHRIELTAGTGDRAGTATIQLTVAGSSAKNREPSQ
jgi:hypothetical protein